MLWVTSLIPAILYVCIAIFLLAKWINDVYVVASIAVIITRYNEVQGYATDWIRREGKRCRGRQKVRWADDIKKFVGKGWPQLAQNRVHWRDTRGLRPAVDIG